MHPLEKVRIIGASGPTAAQRVLSSPAPNQPQPDTAGHNAEDDALNSCCRINLPVRAASATMIDLIGRTRHTHSNPNTQTRTPQNGYDEVDLAQDRQTADGKHGHKYARRRRRDASELVRFRCLRRRACQYCWRLPNARCLCGPVPWAASAIPFAAVAKWKSAHRNWCVNIVGDFPIFCLCSPPSVRVNIVDDFSTKHRCASADYRDNCGGGFCNRIRICLFANVSGPSNANNRSILVHGQPITDNMQTQARPSHVHCSSCWFC